MRFDFSNYFKAFSSRFVYLIGDDGAILVYMEKDKVVRRLFASSSSPEHVAPFLELLNAYPKAPIYVLIDLMDQSYIRHKLPPVSPLGLNKLAARRLDRDFAKDDIKGALNLGREKDGRKDWNFLFISLAVTDQLKSWLDVVLELPNFFGGIYMLPVECEYVVTDLSKGYHGLVTPDADLNLPDAPQEMVESVAEAMPQATDKAESSSEVGAAAKIRFPKINMKREGRLDAATKKAKPVKSKKASFSLSFGKKKGTESADSASVNDVSAPMWQIYITQNKVGGFRQVVLREGKLIFTRQAQSMDGAPAEMIAGNVEQELQNTLEYLKRLAYNPREGLEVFVVMAEDIKQHISSKAFPNIGFYVLTPYEAAQALQLKHAVLSSDRFGDIVVATVFGSRKRKRLKLNMPYTQKLEMLYKSRWGVRVGALLVVIAIALMTVSGVLSLLESEGKQHDLERQKRLKSESLDDAKKTTSGFSTEVDVLTDTIAIHKELVWPVETPFMVLDKVVNIVNDGFIFSRFEWRADGVMPGNPNSEPVELEKRAKPVYTVGFGVEAIYTSAIKDWKQFITDVNAKIASFDLVFDPEEYEMKHSDMPGLSSEGKALEIKDEADKKGPAVGDIFPLTVDVVGPKPKEDPNAAAAAAAPAPAADVGD